MPPTEDELSAVKTLLSDVVYWSRRTTEILEAQQKETRERFLTLERKVDALDLGKQLEALDRGFAAQIHALDEALTTQLRFISNEVGQPNLQASLELAAKILDQMRACLWNYQQAHGSNDSLQAIQKLIDYARQAVYVERGGVAWVPSPNGGMQPLQPPYAPPLEIEATKKRDDDDTGVHIVLAGHEVGRISLRRILVAAKWVLHAGFITSGVGFLGRELMKLLGLFK